MDPIRYQAEEHPLVETQDFATLEAYCLYLMHCKAYETVAEMAQGQAVLDLGCNQGYGTTIIARHAKRALGIDVSPEAIQAAQEVHATDTVEFHVYDGHQIPAEPNSFSLVSSLQVIEHVTDYDTYLGEITRVLQDEGQVVFTTPNAAMRLDPGMTPWYPFHVREFRAEELKAFLSEWFDDVTIKGLFAIEALYQVEYQRVADQRLIARYNALPRLHPSRVKRQMVSKVRRLIPVWAAPAMRRAYHGIKRSGGMVEVEANDASSDWLTYGTTDFFYASEQMDKALDLMAICRQPRRR